LRRISSTDRPTGPYPRITAIGSADRSINSTACSFMRASRCWVRRLSSLHSRGERCSARSVGAMRRKRNGFTLIDRIAHATITLCPASFISPCCRATSERMNENSPICARPIATVSPVRSGYPITATITSAASGLPTMMMPSVDSTSSGSRTMNIGSKSIPTDAKNSTPNASRSGSASAPACCETGDCPTTMPARNAPSAIDAPNRYADPAAVAMAITRIVSVNSSRERSRATQTMMRGTIFAPPHSTSAIIPQLQQRHRQREPNRGPPDAASAG
jgi:hypothetical protein